MLLILNLYIQLSYGAERSEAQDISTISNENNTCIEIDSISGDTIRRVRYIMDNGFINKYKVVKIWSNLV